MSPAPFAPEDVAPFVQYCWEFYSDDVAGALYPLAPSREIERAVCEYVATAPAGAFAGDSVDRYRVRELLESWGFREVAQ